MSSSTVLTPLVATVGLTTEISAVVGVSPVNITHQSALSTTGSLGNNYSVRHSVTVASVKKVFPLCCGARPSLAQSGLGNKSAGREIEIKPSSSSQSRVRWLGLKYCTDI